jgi:outer membrane protein
MTKKGKLMYCLTSRHEAKIFCFLFSVICIVFLNTPSISAETLKIGVFDIQRVMKESKVVQGYRQKLGKEVESKKKLFTEKEESVKQTEEELKKEGQKLSASEKKTLEEKLSNQAKELKRMKEDIDVEIKKMDRELTQQALKDIEGIIKKIASEENYTIIFERNAAGIVHLKDSVDITSKIINFYDKR